MAKLPLLAGAQEILNSTLNQAITLFNSIFKTSANPGFSDPEITDSKYLLDEVILPTHTDVERLALENVQQGELIGNETTHTLNAFLNGRWLQVDMIPYDVTYTYQVKDNGTLANIQGANVTLDGQSQLTDVNGFASIPILPIPAMTTVNLSVSKTGYTTYNTTQGPTPDFVIIYLS